MNASNQDDTLRSTYVAERPDMDVLNRQYEDDVNSSANFRIRCRLSRDLRKRNWPGKSPDLRKHGSSQSPWDGASDTEVPKVEQAIQTLVSICMSALRRGNLRALPVGPSDAKRSADVSNFINYLVRSNTPNFMSEMERAANHLFEREMAITYIGWYSKKPKSMRSFTIDQLRSLSDIRGEAESESGMIDIEVDNDEDAEIIELFTDPLREDEAVEAILLEFPSVKRSKARQAVISLRETGMATLPVDMPRVSYPDVRTMTPDSEVFFPGYTRDVTRADRCHVRFFLTAQDINGLAVDEGWDSKWVENLLENRAGVSSNSSFIGDHLGDASLATNWDTRNIYEVVYTYVKQFDPEDGSEGIYRVVWSPSLINMSSSGDSDYALYQLESGLSSFPVRVTTLKNDGETIYDGESIGTLLHGNQRHAKVTRDSFIDQNSISLNPPTRYPVGGMPPKRGPGVSNPVLPGWANAYQTEDVPNTARNGVYIEEYIDNECDAIVGLRQNNTLDAIRQQEYVNKFLEHVSKVCQAVWESYVIHGDESTFYRVSDTAEPLEFSKDPREESMDVRIEYDIQYNDPDFVQKTIEATSTLLSMDMDGSINRRRAMAVMTHLALPTFASFLIESEEDSRANIINQVQQDIASIATGQPVNARQSGASVALEYIQGYVSQPDVAARLASDQAFASRMNTYIQQYEFQIQQSQNAVTGRLGTEPAEFQLEG